MSTVTKEKKASIVLEFGGNAKNTGSIDAQIALLKKSMKFPSICKPTKKISPRTGD
jgi:hypothetical protein